MRTMSRSIRSIKDYWGIPVLKFHYKFGDNEKAMAADMADSAKEMFEKAGIEVLSVNRSLLYGGLVDSRARDIPHGQRPENKRAESIPTVARCKEPVCSGWEQPRKRVVPEPDLDDYGSVLAVVRLPCRSVEKGRNLMSEDFKRRDLFASVPAAFCLPKRESRKVQLSSGRTNMPRSKN